MKIKHGFLLVLKCWSLAGLFFAAPALALAQCPGNLLTNGALNGPNGENITATGWTGTLTPDINDAVSLLTTTPGYVWLGIPLPSDDGGTWQNLFDTESIEQTITVTPGQTYTLKFEYAAQGIEVPGTGTLFNDPVGIRVMVNGAQILQTPDDATPFTWESVCFSFIANSASLQLLFTATSYQYVAIDGICLLEGNVLPFSIGNDTAICQGQPLLLDATTPGGSAYTWQDGATGPTYPVTQAGTYWVEVDLTGCLLYDTITVTNGLSIDLGPDATLCPGNTLVLDAPFAGAAYLWQDGSTGPSLTVTQPGTYWVEVTTPDCQAADTIEVSPGVLPPEALGTDTVLCEGSTLLLDATTPGATYAWQDGSTGPSFTATQTGTYWVLVSVANCTSADTIGVAFDPLPPIDLGNDTAFCLGSSLLLDATTPGATYTWQDGSTGPSFTATLAGTYWVTATLANCQAADTIVLALASVPAVDLGPTQLLCQGDSLTLDATADGASYLWEDGSAAATRLITEAGTYWVQVSHACGVLTDQVKVEVSDCNCYIYFPNVFSPNGDGFNDAFAPFPSCPYEAYRLQVFDRWGALVFDNSDPAAAWDGSIKGKAASLGVYVYLATFRFAKDPAPQLRSGALNLVR